LPLQYLIHVLICSAGIEPQPANVYVFNGAKGTFIVKNPELEKLLIAKGKNTSKFGIKF
jgi:ribonucleoside-diphosphate reductase alpha chain